MRRSEVKTITDPRTTRDEIERLLGKVGVPMEDVQVSWDVNSGSALLRFLYNGKWYEHRSTKQKELRANVRALKIFIQHKILAHIRGIEDFGLAVSPYLRLGGETEPAQQSSQKTIPPEAQKAFGILGMSDPFVSNEEIEKKYKVLAKMYHPDRAFDEDTKKEMSEQMLKINGAYEILKKYRNF